MNIDEFSQWLASRNEVCERETPCHRCENRDWCNCTESKDYKKWLSAEGEL